MTESGAASRWTDASLDAWRRVGDPEVDAIARRLFEQSGPQALGRLTRQLEDWEAPIPADAPADLLDLFARPVDYPGWVDPDLIAHAEDLFVSYGVVTTSVVLLHAFPRFLTNPAGARAFYTARIFSPDSLRNRMLELAQFVIYMAERGGLGQSWLSPAQAAARGLPHGVRKGRGTVAMQKLRVIHANVRILLEIAKEAGRPVWEEAAFGAPINQEDLAEATLGFALCSIDGLKKFGIKQTRLDQDAILMVWRTTGFLLGLADDLQPSTLEEARALWDHCFRRHARHTHEGAEVTRDVRHVIEALTPPGFRRVPAALMRYQLGEEVADLLDVPTRRWLLFVVSRPLLERTHVFAALAKLVNPGIVRWASARERLGGARRLVLPERVAERLGSGQRNSFRID